MKPPTPSGIDYSWKPLKRTIFKCRRISNIIGVHDITGVHIDVLYPPVDFSEKSRIQTWRNLDNNSLVLKVSFGGVSFLFPGDIKTPAEYALVSTVGDKLKKHGTFGAASRQQNIEQRKVPG